MGKQDSEAAGKLPLQDNGIAKTSNAPARTSRLGHLYIIPLLMLTLFTGAVIGMYFQPPGLRVFFDATGLQPGAGSNMPIAIAV